MKGGSKSQWKPTDEDANDQGNDQKEDEKENKLKSYGSTD
jgi:hypothetical protein